MSTSLRIFLRWLPAVSMMLIIFWFSGQPSYELPDFHWADRIVKKGGHMLGYAILALSYWHAFDFKKERGWLAWSLAVVYAVTDEFHQTFVPGRFPSVWDVLIFDNLGAAASLWLWSLYKKQRPDLVRPIVEKLNH